MLPSLLYLLFIVSVALTAGSIILSTRLRRTFADEVFSVLLYYLAFIFAFGFYGIWGQVVFSTYLSGYIDPSLLYRISDVGLLIGLPFLVFAWFMMLRLSLMITGRKAHPAVTLIFLVFNFIIIIVLGYYVTGSETGSTELLRNYFIGANFIYTILFSAIMEFPGDARPIVRDNKRRVIAVSVLLIMLAQNIPLIFYRTYQPLPEIFFIFTFFAGHTFFPVYFTYGNLFSKPVPVQDIDTFDEFCKKYEISPREIDVIREICNGLSNQEISDKLFISLQTVKDHTHRIYIKTGVKSRVQLINLLKDIPPVR